MSVNLVHMFVLIMLIAAWAAHGWPGPAAVRGFSRHAQLSAHSGQDGRQKAVRSAARSPNLFRENSL